MKLLKKQIFLKSLHNSPAKGLQEIPKGPQKKVTVKSKVSCLSISSIWKR
jgi:hypothetical protein